MQKRMQRLLLNTISYIEQLSASPFSNSAVSCALSDLEYYTKIAGCDDIYINKIREIVACFERHSNCRTISSVVYALRSLYQNLQSTIYVDFIILRQTHWGAIKPLVDAFIENKCHVRIIPTPMIQEKQDLWGRALSQLIQKDGYHVEDFEEYDIEKALPDIVIDNMAVDCAKIPEFRFLRIASLVDNTIHIEHSILTGITEAIKWSHFRIGRSSYWQYVVPLRLFSVAFPLIFRIDGEYLPMGCPELDSVYLYQNSCKVNNKEQCILWNIDALDPDSEIPGDYERLLKELEYLENVARRYPSIMQIVRTHPNFRNQKKCQILSEMLDSIVSGYDNVSYDKNRLIIQTYSDVDAMVTWMSSSTLFSFAVTGKPIIVMPTYIDGGYDTMLDMYLLQVVPIAYSIEDFEHFIAKIEDDPDKIKRIKIFQKYAGPLDGTASKRIVNEAIIRYEKYIN